jgi:HK97 family phage portal protein
MSAENPEKPLSQADDDILEWMGSTKTASGVRVSRRKALGYSAVWRAVNLIAGDVGRLPHKVYRRKGTGKEPDPTHPAYRLVNRKPNSYMTTFTFRQTVQAHALLNGNGYAYIVRNADAKPVELLILNPEATWPVRWNGQLWYTTTVMEAENNGTLRRLPPEDVLHIRGLSFDGLVGYPVLQVLRESLGKAIAGRDYGARYFKNSARPGTVLEVPTGMKPEAITNLRESWERLHTGLDNSHKAAILRDGVKLVLIESKARDAQLIENLEFDAREVANVFGVPAHKVGDASKTAYNSLESENQSYYDDSLDRWLVVWEEEEAEKLLTEEEKDRDSHTIEVTRQALLRTNLAARGDYYSKAIQGGWLNRDEVRDFENLNPIPGGFGQEFLRPVNMTPASGDNSTDTNDTPDETVGSGVRSALRLLVKETAGRMARRLATHAERLARRPEELRTWLDSNQGLESHRTVVAEAFEHLATAVRSTGVPADAEEAAVVILTEFRTQAPDMIGIEEKIAAAVLNHLFPEEA